MNFPGNPEPMTAMKPTKEFMQKCKDILHDPETVPDDDPIYDGYIVSLPDKWMTIAPNAEEFFEVFEFIDGEKPGEFAPIKYKD